MKTLPILTEQPQRLRLRGHTLLCLQGFRGRGYSQAFIDNLAMIHKQLADNDTLPIEVIDTADAVCGACPHQIEALGCTLNGPGGEVPIQLQDRVVLTRLGLRIGDRLTWGDLVNRIRDRIVGDDLTKICGQCRWLSLGYCRTGIDRLREPA